MIKSYLSRAAIIACLCLSPAFSIGSQQTYQSPPADLLRILDAPANPVVSISPNRQWVLVTVSDPRTITISDMADLAHYLARSKIRANPDFRIDNIGVRSATISGVDGGNQRSLDVPSGGRIGSTAWSRGNQLAYTTISNGTMSLYVIDAASGRATRVGVPNMSGRIRDLSWSTDGKHLAFTTTTPPGTALWVADVSANTARRLTPASLNFTTARGNIVDDPGCDWLNGKAPLVCRLFATNRSALPRTSDVPTGVIVQE